MQDDRTEPKPTAEEPSRKQRSWLRLTVIGVVAAVFAGIMFAKVTTAPPAPPAGVAHSATSVTAVRNDASADYAAARGTGKPIYVLFHSLS